MESHNNFNNDYGFKHGRRQRDQFEQGPYYYEHEYGRNQDNYTNQGSENKQGNRHAAKNLAGYGMNSQSHNGGRAYGQNYDQQHQGNYYSDYSGRKNYEGLYDERPGMGYNNYSSDANSRGFDNRDQTHYNNNDDYYYNRDANDDRPYSRSRSNYEQEQDNAYQSSGHTEGFGHRDSRRSENDWEYEDEYRGGHGQNHSAYGKYGSR